MDNFIYKNQVPELYGRKLGRQTRARDQFLPSHYDSSRALPGKVR